MEKKREREIKNDRNEKNLTFELLLIWNKTSRKIN